MEPINGGARQRWLAPRYGAYLLNRSGLRAWADLGDAATIETLVQRFRQALQAVDNSYRTPARELYRQLLEPLRLDLDGLTHLMVSPDGMLNVVPFAAILTPDNDFLVERVAISYLHSGRDVIRPGAPADTGAVVVVADPDFGRSASPQEDRYAPLEGPRREADLIRTLVPTCTVLSQQHATKSALKELSAPAVLHIATHGEYQEAAPLDPPQTLVLHDGESSVARPDVLNPLLRSWLALAGANAAPNTNGLITAMEITTLPLQGTALVTLSACDTAVGEVRAGDGIYGLSRAFLLAGARSLFVALWSIEDDGTYELIQRIYTHLCAGAPRVDALTTAQRELLNTEYYGPPFYWSAFVLIGEAHAVASLAAAPPPVAM
jgi:CHAT domain-containing protein